MRSRLAEILLAVLVVITATSLYVQVRSHGQLRQLLVEIYRSDRNSDTQKLLESLVRQSHDDAAPIVEPPPPTQPPAAANPVIPPQTKPVINDQPQPSPVPVAAPTPAPRDETLQTAEPAQAKPLTPEHPQPAPASQPQPWDELAGVYRGIVEDLMGGRYEAVAKRFSPVYAYSVKQADIARVLDPLRKSTGPFSKMIRHELITVGVPAGHHAYRLTAAGQSGPQLMFTITLDDQRQISGLFVRSTP